MNKCDQRTEVVNDIPIHAWSRVDPQLGVWDDQHLEHHPGNGNYEVVYLDRATVYQTRGLEPVTGWSRDNFVMTLAIMRATRSGTVWPFYGQGITDAGPSPYGWLWD